jgi:hypothetical protein
VKVEKVVISNQKPDAERAVNRSRFGEYEISDGSGGVRMNDESALIRWGDELPYVFPPGQHQNGDRHRFYTFSNHKSRAARFDGGFARHQKFGTAVKEQSGLAPATYDLAQNYPNPF